MAKIWLTTTVQAASDWDDAPAGDENPIRYYVVTEYHDESCGMSKQFTDLVTTDAAEAVDLANRIRKSNGKLSSFEQSWQ